MKVWGHLGHWTVWVGCKRPGWEEALSDFGPLKKTSTFEFVPHPAQGVHTQTRWSLAWGDLTYPLPHARNHVSLAHHGAAQWEGEVGPHWPRLRTSCLGQSGPRGQEGMLFWAPPSTTSLSWQVATPSSLTQFSGVWGPGKHPRGSYLNAWSDLCQTHRGPVPWWGPPSLKRVSGWNHLPESSAGISKTWPLVSIFPEKWAWSNLLETHKGPAPDGGEVCLENGKRIPPSPWKQCCPE